MQLPVETERTKARGVATILAHPGDDVVLELQKLRSWILTRGLHPIGRGSWTITDRPSSQVRHNVDRDDIETETVPQERAWLQAIPSQFVAKVQVPIPSSTTWIAWPGPSPNGRQPRATK